MLLSILISFTSSPTLYLEYSSFISKSTAEKSIGANDVTEQSLIRALANAQMSGGDVTGAKAALDAYLSERNAARYSELSKMASQDEKDVDKAQKNYVVRLKHCCTRDRYRN